jgi:GNAT superfamily N-acetyltransferase
MSRTLRTAIAHRGPADVLEVGLSITEAHASHPVCIETWTATMHTAAGTRLGYATGDRVTWGDDDLFDVLDDIRRVCDEEDGDLADVVVRSLGYAHGDPTAFLYLARVEIDPGLRGLGLGQWIAAELLGHVGPGTLVTLVAGFGEGSPHAHGPAELAAINRLVDGLPLRGIGGRVFTGELDQAGIEQAQAAAAQRITEALAAA